MDLREEGCTHDWNWPGIMYDSRPNIWGVKSAGYESFRYDRNRQEVD
jgi:hypothetical protein